MVAFEHAIGAVMASLLINRSIAGRRKKLKKVVGSLSYRIGITCGYVKEYPASRKAILGMLWTMAHAFRPMRGAIRF